MIWSRLIVAALIASAGCGGGQPVEGAPAPEEPAEVSQRDRPAPAAPAERRSKPKADAADQTPTGPCETNASSRECKCERGETEACLKVADALFRRGDHDQAIIQAYSLCQKRHSDACFRAAHYMTKLNVQKRFGATPSELRDEGVSIAKQGCADGDAPACYVYGKLLVTGKLVAADAALGQTHLETACTAGHAPACSFLASALETGAGGLPKDNKRALELWDRACAAGAAASCTVLGDKVSRKDGKRARSLYQSACDGDDGAGCARMAKLHLAARRHADALASLVKACELDHATSCVGAGALTEAGKGTARDPARARELYQTACDDDVGAGCHGLAVLLAKAVGGDRHWGNAVALSKRACKLDFKRGCAYARRLERRQPDWRCTTAERCDALCDEHIERSCRKLGELLADSKIAELVQHSPDGFDPPDTWTSSLCDDAEAAFRRGCEHGDGVSCLRVGKYDEACAAGTADGCVKASARDHKEGDAADKKRALKTLQKMCSKRRGASACTQLAVLISDSDPKKAGRLLNTACNRRHAAACRLLGYHLGADGSFPGGTTPCENESLAECADNIEAARRQATREERAAQKGRDLIRRACDLGDLEACQSPEQFYTETVAKQMAARSLELWKTQSCGRGGIGY